MWGAQAPGEGAFWGELAASALHPRLLDGIAALDFDSLEEGLWLGSEGGVVGQMQAPSLARYSSVPAHAGPLLDVRSLGEAAVALSAGELTVHSSGGAQRLAYADEVGDAGGRPRMCWGSCRKPLKQRGLPDLAGTTRNTIRRLHASARTPTPNPCCRWARWATWRRWSSSRTAAGWCWRAAAAA